MFCLLVVCFITFIKILFLSEDDHTEAMNILHRSEETSNVESDHEPLSKNDRREKNRRWTQYDSGESSSKH